MNVFRWSAYLVGGLVVIITLFLAYMGVLFPPTVTEQEKGPYDYIYRSHKGDYSGVGRVFEDVESQIKAAGMKVPSQAIGIYYDDPRQVVASELRSDCGYVTETENIVANLPDNLKRGHLDKRKSIVVSLPLRNSLSAMLGPMLSYPALSKYAEDRGYKATAVFELYDESTKKIDYVMQIE